ncbi:acetamidase/formamidase family protein [Saccharopolyspora sp. 5N708]|uniref:acetamidase/formamidase family protein n=1 Tax=Saccharopolyspora sp. 5N708 TaxID=3457424 RepID=UPI003FCF8124
MIEHRLQPAANTVTDFFSRDAQPVLTVDPGDTVVVGSLDSRGYLERQDKPGEQRPTMFGGRRRGHCLTGPIAVRGAEPGAVLAVHLESMRPDEWGWTVAGAKDDWLNRKLGVASTPTWLLWELDAERGTGTNDRGHTVPLTPFLGVIGMPPDEPGEHSTIPPRPSGGGNIDCRELVAGSTIYLPITVPGGLLLLGDGHAAQGNGEVSGTAIECGMTTRVRLDIVPEPQAPGIHAETPSGRVTFGFHENLNEATAIALNAMLTWMQSHYNLDRPTALALASSAVDLRITQIANETWGVHAVQPETAIR